MQNILYQISSIFDMAVREYRQGTLVETVGPTFAPDLIAPYLSAVLAVRGDVTQMSTRSLHCYGAVRTKDGAVYVAGPVVRMKPDEIEFKEICLEMNLAPEARDSLRQYLDTLPVMPLHKFAQVLCVVNSAINGTDVRPETVMIGEWPQLPEPEAVAAGSPMRSEQNYDTERHLMALVTRGDIRALKEYMMQTTFRQDYRIADDSLRNIRNILIVSATLATRAAIAGGLEPERAFSLSDMYIRTVETLASPREIYDLMVRMLLDFTERVGAGFTPAAASPATAACLRYIRRNISRPITAKDVAEHMHVSRGYLASVFQKEIGTTVSQAIALARVEEAKRLLRQTDKPLADIAAYLCFSSQSHFQNVFRRWTRTTPGRYRLADTDGEAEGAVSAAMPVAIPGRDCTKRPGEIVIL